jgi:hypothetical protein
VPDVGRLLRGEASLTTAERLLVASAVTGEEHAATREDLAALLEVPVAHWVVPAEVGLEESRANAFTERGWVLREDDAEGRLRDDAPGAARWNAHAAMYHGLTRWRGVETRQELPVVDSAELAELARTGAAELVRRYGRPPPAFVERAGGPVFELPLRGPRTRVSGARCRSGARRERSTGMPSWAQPSSQEFSTGASAARASPT